MIYSKDMAHDLGFSVEDLESDVFLKYFSGDLDVASKGVEGVSVESWATPYALSIMGRRYTNNVSNVGLAIVHMCFQFLQQTLSLMFLTTSSQVSLWNRGWLWRRSSY